MHRRIGSLLVDSGLVSVGQLEQGLRHQTESHLPLCQDLVQLGLLSEDKSLALLRLQQALDECENCSPEVVMETAHVRLGELLLDEQVISPEQLDQALTEQAKTHEPLGQVIIDKGFARPRQVRYARKVQRRLRAAAVAACMFSTLPVAAATASDHDAMPEQTEISTSAQMLEDASNKPLNLKVSFKDLVKSGSDAASTFEAAARQVGQLTMHQINGMDRIIDRVEFNKPIDGIAMADENTARDRTSQPMEESDYVGLQYSFRFSSSLKGHKHDKHAWSLNLSAD